MKTYYKNSRDKKIKLEEIKKIQIDMLLHIDAFCKLRGIDYYLMYGTLLGAIRHNGYIPWDDDIDIVMFRDDYEKFFLDFNKKEYASKYHAISTENNSNYYLPMGKVIDTTTILLEDMRDAFPIGVYIDIFPIDNLPEDKEKIKCLLHQIRILTRLLSYKQSFWDERRSVKKNIFYGIARFILTPVSYSSICKRINLVASKYKNNKKSVFIGSMVLGLYGEREIWKRENFVDSIKWGFEGEYFTIPIGYDQILRRLYGEYMIPPPKEEQKSHHRFLVFWR